MPTFGQLHNSILLELLKFLNEELLQVRQESGKFPSFNSIYATYIHARLECKSSGARTQDTYRTAALVGLVAEATALPAFDERRATGGGRLALAEGAVVLIHDEASFAVEVALDLGTDPLVAVRQDGIVRGITRRRLTRAHRAAVFVLDEVAIESTVWQLGANFIILGQRIRRGLDLLVTRGRERRFTITFTMPPSHAAGKRPPESLLSRNFVGHDSFAKKSSPGFYRYVSDKRNCSPVSSPGARSRLANLYTGLATLASSPARVDSERFTVHEETLRGWETALSPQVIVSQNGTGRILFTVSHCRSRVPPRARVLISRALHTSV